jgi:hypothetical protein
LADARTLHRIGGTLARHHQAGGGEDTDMGAFHRFVHRDCGAEIVSGDNQAFRG